MITAAPLRATKKPSVSSDRAPSAEGEEDRGEVGVRPWTPKRLGRVLKVSYGFGTGSRTRRASARQRGLELRLQLGVEEAERELVVADQVDELLGLLDLGQVAPVGAQTELSVGGT